MWPRSGKKEADQSDGRDGANDDGDARRRQRRNGISCWRSLRASMRLLPLFHHWTEPRNMLEGYLCEPQNLNASRQRHCEMPKPRGLKPRHPMIASTSRTENYKLDTAFTVALRYPSTFLT